MLIILPIILFFYAKKINIAHYLTGITQYSIIVLKIFAKRQIKVYPNSGKRTVGTIFSHKLDSY